MSKKTAGKTVKKTAVKSTKSTAKKVIGTWKVKRVGENQIQLTVPEGIKIQGQTLNIEDVMGAIANYMVVKKGKVLACCHGNIAIA